MHHCSHALLVFYYRSTQYVGLVVVRNERIAQQVSGAI